jgi:membrane protein DedA with SNARE-associated domain
VEAIRRFVRASEDGTAPVRAAADPARIAAAAAPFDPAHVPRAEGLTLVVFLLLIALATLVSEDLACISAGFLVAQGTIGYLPAVLASFLGIFAGDMGLFLAGRWLGRPVVQRRPFNWFLDEQSLKRGARWLERRGAGVIFASRFVPGSRLPTYVAAGLLGMRFRWFACYFFLAAAVWTPILVGLAAFLGREVQAYVPLYEDYALPVLLGTALGLWLVVKLVVPLFSRRGRRLLLSSWRRKARWEFWPMWFFYPPVVLYVLFLALRYRSLTVFTAVNPAIAHGGFVGESKAEILEGLAGAGNAVARHTVVEPSENLGARAGVVAAFMEAEELAYPVVLKPDVGERGLEVAVVRSAAEVRDYLASHRGRTVVLAYAGGLEYGVFYYRYPGEAIGSIFAITDKRFPTVVGDGHRTLERLILDDDRAVCMAPYYFKLHDDDLFDVPERGEAVQLVEIGTHSRGALFLDGTDLKTPALEAAIDRISKTFDGFFFGRYDIRTPSVEDFQQGRNLKVVELNGVTSEATSIYDPQNGVFEAYRVLMEQWRIAFEIGAENVRRGVRPSTVGELWRALRGTGGR